jgi:hypothetical protein
MKNKQSPFTGKVTDMFEEMLLTLYDSFSKEQIWEMYSKFLLKSNRLEEELKAKDLVIDHLQTLLSKCQCDLFNCKSEIDNLNLTNNDEKTN